MEPIKYSDQTIRWDAYWSSGLVVALLVILPYASYITLIGLAILVLMTLLRHRSEMGRLLYRSGWWIIAAGMILTVAVAQYPLEATLQLANFLPFMLFLSAIASVLPHLAHPFRVLERWAAALLVASIPVTIRAIVEYGLKIPALAARLSGRWYFDWLYAQPDYGHRADSVFGHPNVLASYLVMLFGLGLGLTLRWLRRRRWETPFERKPYSWWERPAWIYAATVLLPAGIFCSGSRNGVLVAIAQLLIFGWLMRRNRFVMITGVAAITALVVGVLVWGIGGRNLVEAFSTISLRVGVWQLAVDMIQQHPWLGSGLGSYKLLYVPYTVEPYDKVEHAHNLWLMLAAELGVPLMLGITAVVGWACWRGVYHIVRADFEAEQRYLLTGYLLAFVGCSLFALFDLAFYDSRANLLGWLTLAVIQAIPRLGKRTAARPVDLSQAKSA